MNVRQYRRTWLRLHSRYELITFRIFRNALRESAQRVKFDGLSKTNYRLLVNFNIPEQNVEAAFVDSYNRVGVLYGNRVGRAINKEIKNFSPDTFSESFRNTLLEWLRANAGDRIVSVRQSLVDYLIKEIEKGINEGLTVRQIAANMQKLVNRRDFYRWQAMRIARTETTAAANHGAILAAEDSGVVVEKQWISSNDERTRQIEKGDQYDHIDMNGIRVAQDGLFDVQGDMLRFPGDPKGQAANTINCRCTLAMVPKRDSNGRLIFKD